MKIDEMKKGLVNNSVVQDKTADIKNVFEEIAVKEMEKEKKTAKRLVIVRAFGLLVTVIIHTFLGIEISKEIIKNYNSFGSLDLIATIMLIASMILSGVLIFSLVLFCRNSVSALQPSNIEEDFTEDIMLKKNRTEDDFIPLYDISHPYVYSLMSNDENNL